jgi:hypothetical protein
MADINEAKSWLSIATRDISVAKHLDRSEQRPQ